MNPPALPWRSLQLFFLSRKPRLPFPAPRNRASSPEISVPVSCLFRAHDNQVSHKEQRMKSHVWFDHFRQRTHESSSIATKCTKPSEEASESNLRSHNRRDLRRVPEPDALRAEYV